MVNINKRKLISLISTLIVLGSLNTIAYSKNNNSSNNTEIIEIYNDNNLRNANYYYMTLVEEAIDNKFISQLPECLETLNLYTESFISDLSVLPQTCPHLKRLTIVECYMLDNFDFIKDLNELEYLYIDENCIGITDELISYLNSKGVEHNLSSKHVEINNAINNIYLSINDFNMSDNDKFHEMCKYVMDNMEYDKEALIDDDLLNYYNDSELYHGINGKGVCINYSTLINALFRKAGLISTVVENDDHAWNLVCLDGKFYYLDLSSMDNLSKLFNYIFNNFDIGLFYKQTPYVNAFTSMSNINDLRTKVPNSFLELIKEAEDTKSFIEKYGSNLFLNLLDAITILLGIEVYIISNRIKINNINKKR